MDLIDYLRAQHDVFLRQLVFLDKMRIRKGKDQAGGLKEAALIIATGVKRHAHLEEKLLFSRLKKKTKNADLFRSQQVDHRILLTLLNRLKQARDPQKIRIETGKFIRFLKDHILKEETVLYRSAEDLLALEEVEVGDDLRRLDLRLGITKR